MMGALITLGVLGLLVVVAIAVVAGAYNSLVTLRNRYKNAYSQIDVQLKRRYDLIPNLVEIAKGVLKHERETLEAVMQARGVATAAQAGAAAAPGDPAAMARLGQAESAMQGAMARFYAVSEAYPQLKANQNMMQLTEELTSTENKVAFARQAYNDAVMVYNTEREKFPTVMIAGMLNFTEAWGFVIEDSAEREAPRVSFS